MTRPPEVLEEQISESRGLPEYKLLIAILSRALLDFLAPVRSQGKLSNPGAYYGSRNWILSRSNKPWTFHWICDHLNLDASPFRQLVFRAKLRMDCYDHDRLLNFCRTFMAVYDDSESEGLKTPVPQRRGDSGIPSYCGKSLSRITRLLQEHDKRH